MKKIRVIHFGLGPIGCGMARLVAQRESLEIVGAVDVNPNLIGKSLNEVAGIDKDLTIKIMGSLSEVLKTTSADIVVHTTSSYFDIFKPQLLEIISHGLNIVSTAEELSFPWHHHAAEGKEIDDAAKAKGVTVLGTGINPGFLMDSLPINLTSIAQKVNHFDIKRAQNASKRRGPFQKKIGAGMTPAEFKIAMASGRMGHVGLPESMAMLFATFNKKLVTYKEKIMPVIAKKQTTTSFFDVAAGNVIGLRQTARGFSESGEFCKMTFVAYLDNREDRDTIKLSGSPDLRITLEGTNGDIGTAAITINAIKRVVQASAGLVTMKDLPSAHCE